MHTYGGHFYQFLLFCLSEISFAMWYNSWLFKMDPVLREAMET